jgi:amino acid transporter
VAQDKFLPKWLERENNHGVPVALLLTQAIVGSLLAMVFLYIRDHSASIWFLTALSAQFTFVQYTLVFCAALRLRYLQPKTVRAFRVPAIWLVAGLGIISCIFSFAIVYAPHVKLVSIGLGSYCSLLTLSFVLLLSPALLLINFRTKN